MKIHNIILYLENPDLYSGGFCNFNQHEQMKNLRVELIKRRNDLHPIIRLIKENMLNPEKYHVKFQNYKEKDVYYDDITVLPINRSSQNLIMVINSVKKQYTLLIRENVKIVKRINKTSLIDIINTFNEYQLNNPNN